MESPHLLSPRGDGSVIDAPGCGSTSLHWACANGRVEDVEALLAAGRGVGARDGGGRTPLHWAVLKGRGAVARALLDAGADAGAADDSGRTALMAAARAAARRLLGAPPYRDGAGAPAPAAERDGGGATPLHWAARSGDAPLVAPGAARGRDAPNFRKAPLSAVSTRLG